MLDDFFNVNLGSLDSLFNDNSTRRYPFTNIAYDKDKTVYVTMALAGFKKEDLKVEFKDCELKVQGSRDGSSKDGLTYIQKYISEDGFTKTIKFYPEVYQGADVSAKMQDGLLSIVIKPKERVEVKSIEIL